MKHREVSVRVPASTSNLGPGFDCFGLALGLYNDYRFRTLPSGLHVHIRGEGSSELSRGSDNLIVQAAKLVFRKLGRTLPGLQIACTNRIPLARGLGSSATAVVGGMLAANAFCGEKLSREEILELACALEGHPDNVAPSLFGGFTVVASAEDGKPLVLQPPWPRELLVVLAIPEQKLSTKKARDLLPRNVPLGDAVFNLSRSALFVEALRERRWDILSEATEDRLHQPYRARVIRGFLQALRAARFAGARGAVLSGSGTALAAFAETAARAKRIRRAFAEALKKAGVRAETKILRPDLKGARVVHGQSRA